MRNSRQLLALAVSLIATFTSNPVHASFASNDVFVPSVGRGEGASGSFWYTTVWFHNPGSNAVEVSVSLLLRDQPNSSPDQQDVTVPAGSTMTFKDAVHDLFGLDSAVGALRIQADQPLAVGSRIYNQTGDAISESQGQFMAGIPASFSAVPGGMVEVPGILQPADESFRSNYVIDETSGSTPEVKVSLLDDNGVELGSDELSLGPFFALQRSVASLAAGATVEGGILRVEVLGASGAVLAFASAVANGVNSQDPTTLEMTLDSGLLSGGAITGINAGPGLTGGGTEGIVSLEVQAGDGIEVTAFGVSLRDGGVTADSIAPGEVVLGAKVGNQVLTDVVTFAGGPNVDVEADGNTVTFSALSCLGERTEVPITQAVVASSAGTWVTSGNQLSLPSAGRWRVGYRVLTELRNYGLGTTSDPVTIALYDATGQSLLRSTLSVVGLQVNLNSSAFTTVSGDTVVHVDRPTTIRLVARTSSATLVPTVHPHDVNLSASLPSPDAASFMFSECLVSE